MATYPVDIAALPPLASRVDDNPAPPIAQGDLLHLDHVNLAEAQFQNRRRLFKCIPPLATQDEVLASKRRKHDVESVNFVGVDVPLWAVALQQQMANMATQQQNMERMIRQESQRSINRSRKSTSEPIEMVVRLNDVQFPNHIWFPNDQDALMLAPANRINPLLEFYDLDLIGTLTEKRFV
jgi:hypothetical protein